ncbi:MAG: peptidylprolyl isomerase [Synechococcus sp. BS307-5m-G38]|nr:peptidylprolyl isomerase [Synechococcus sp. BS307-5m-G38]
MDGGTTLPELRRSISAEGRDLLRRYNLLQPLVEQMITTEAIAGLPVPTDALEKAQLDLLDQRGFESLDQWPDLLKDLGRPHNEVIERLERVIRRQEFMRERFAPKAEARFLERKSELDQVVYSLLRLGNSFLARELYLQIESGESNFADLAKRYAEGPERNTNGIVGPVSLTQAHPVLVEKLRVSQPGVLLEPFRIADWWLVVRLERYSPATFTEEVSDRMCREMFDAWIAEQTTSTLSRLEADFSDFSIS